MTDIRKDFEELPPVFDAGTSLDYIKGFQAGRAHDIDGLIAEICNESIHDGDGEYYLKVHEITEIIRKHFWKE